MSGETEQARTKRLRNRLLFDTVADRYYSSRLSYPGAVVEHLCGHSGTCAGGRVLEVGCGTGQLTEKLAQRGAARTAIDIGTSMIERARRRVATGDVESRSCSFEDLDVADGSFDMVVAADAFHWMDPDLRFTKSARVLRTGGWLAVLSTVQVYDEPIASTLRQLWVARSDDGRAWLSEYGPTVRDQMTGSGLFDIADVTVFRSRCEMAAESMVDFEATRATSLSWTESARRAFTDELRGHVATERVHLTQVVTVAMATVRPGRHRTLTQRACDRDSTH